MASKWPSAFWGISAQIKSSDNLHPENQSLISMSTNIEVRRILKPDWPRTIWCFNSKMSQVAYITDTCQLMQSRDWVGQRMTCSMLFTY